MENDQIQCIVLVDKTVLISKIGAVVSELGEPDCRLDAPHEVIGGKLSPWLSDLTDMTEEIMISSDKILTLVDPKQTLLNDYLELIK